MIGIKTKVRDWGNSLGIVIPNQTVENLKIHGGEEIRVLLLKDHNALQKTFATFKFKKSTEKLLMEVDKESWNR